MFLSLKSSLGAPGFVRSVPYVNRGLLFTVDTSISTLLTVNLDSGASYSGVVDWGDGSADTILSGTGNTSISHTFASTGVYQVRVSGSSVPKFRLQGQQNVVSVESLGDVGLQDTADMFRDCINLANVFAGNYVTSIGDRTFIGCTLLTSVTLPENVNFTTLSYQAFKDCTSLTSIIIPNSVSIIEDFVFYNCNSLTSVIIPDSVTSIDTYVFFGCTLLATVDLSLPKSVIDAATNIFQGTASPLTLNVPLNAADWTSGSGQSIGGNTNVTVYGGVSQDLLFTVDTSISASISLTLDGSQTYIGTIDWGDGSNPVTIQPNVTTMTRNYSPNGIFQVRVSGSSVPWLRLISQLNVVSVENLGAIGWTNFKDMFTGCSNLVSFNTGNTDTSNVTNMDAMFQNCNSLTSLNLQSFDTSNVTRFIQMFSGCTLLNQLNLPSNFVTATGTITISMFFQCSSLTSLDVSSWITSNVASMSNMFNGMLAIPDITGIENFDITAINPAGGLNSFCRNTQLTTATYNDLLINFEAQYNAAPVPLNGLAPYFKATATGAAALAARTSLINNYNWVITDLT